MQNILEQVEMAIDGYNPIVSDDHNFMILLNEKKGFLDKNLRYRFDVSYRVVSPNGNVRQKHLPMGEEFPVFEEMENIFEARVGMFLNGEYVVEEFPVLAIDSAMARVQAIGEFINRDGVSDVSVMELKVSA